MIDTCKNCNDTGRNPGSDYLDCTHCDYATERAGLIVFVAGCMRDNPSGVGVDWAVHKRAYAMGLEAAKKTLLSDKWVILPKELNKEILFELQDSFHVMPGRARRIWDCILDMSKDIFTGKPMDKKERAIAILGRLGIINPDGSLTENYGGKNFDEGKAP